MYFKMAWRNIWRNPRRTLLTVSAIAFASLLLVFMLSFQFGSYETMINSSVKIYTGHLQVQAKGYQDKKDMRLVVPAPETIGTLIEKIQGVDAYTFRAEAFSLVSSAKRTYGVLVTGIDPVREQTVSTLKKMIREGEFFSENDTDKALIGRLLAENMHVNTGDELTILGQARDGSIAATVVTIKGIYSSGIDEFDRSAIQIPLAFFQDTYAMQGAAHKVVITAESLRRVPDIKNTLVQELHRGGMDRSLAVLDWSELTPGLLQSIKLDMISGFIMYFILIIVVAFSILNTFLMAILERTKEFGVMMAIGLTPGRLTWLVLVESILLTLTGIVAGVILGCLITLYFQAYGINMAGMDDIMSQFGIPGRIYPRLSFVTAVTGPAAVLLITSLSALYPALKVRKLKPVAAMAHI